MNKALILFITCCLVGTFSKAQSVFDTNNKISVIPIIDGDYGGILIPNAGIGIGYSRIINRKYEVEATFGYKVGVLGDNESLAIVKIANGELDKVSFKRVTEIGLKMRLYLFNSFGAMAPIGAYAQFGLQRSVLDLTHYDFVAEFGDNKELDTPRFARARTIDFVMGIGKSVPWKNNIIVGAYGGIAFPLALKYIEYTDPEGIVIDGDSDVSLSYYRSRLGGEKMYFFANNGFQVRLSIAKAF